MDVETAGPGDAGAGPRVALVTGAGRGIGRATALALAEEGFRVGLFARSVDELEQTAAGVHLAGAEALVIPGDVTIESDVKAAVSRILEEWSTLSLLVNNAGAARFGPIEELTLEDWEFNLRVNLTGTFLCCREAIPALVQSGRGMIVNVSSSSGKKGYPTQAGYVAAKHGVQGLSKVLAMELRDRGVRVHAVCPGAVDTRMSDEIHPHRDRTGWLQALDVAEVIRFLVTRPSHLAIDEIVIRRFGSDVMF